MAPQATTRDPNVAGIKKIFGLSAIPRYLRPTNLRWLFLAHKNIRISRVDLDGSGYLFASSFAFDEERLGSPSWGIADVFAECDDLAVRIAEERDNHERSCEDSHVADPLLGHYWEPELG